MRKSSWLMFKRNRPSRNTRLSRLGFESLESRRVLAAVSIADVSAEPGSDQIVPINIDSASGVRAAEIRLNYNTQFLDLSNNSVAAGSVWGGANDTQVTANIDDAAGTAVIFISSSEALGAIAGSLASLNFRMAAGAPIGTTINLDLIEVVLNEGGVPVTPAPQPGLDPTDGVISIVEETAGGTDRISGFVFADANASGTQDVGEAIPRVTIRLINTASNAVQETTTADDGSYQFTSVAAGSYRIEQVQPLAYIDQSPNTLSVQLLSGGALENQNFIERGLRAGFLYTRLLTTLVPPVDSTPWRAAIRQMNLDAASGSAAPVTAASAGLTQTATATTATPSSFSSTLSSGGTTTSGSVSGNAGAGQLLAEGEAVDYAQLSWQLPVYHAHASDSLERERLAAIDSVLETHE